MNKMEKRVIFKKEDIEESIQKMAKEIVEKNSSMEDVVLVGIRTGGAFLAKRLQESIARLNALKPLAICYPKTRPITKSEHCGNLSSR